MILYVLFTLVLFSSYRHLHSLYRNDGKAIVKSIGESFSLQGISSEEILSFQKNRITKIVESRNWILKIKFFDIFSCI